MKNTENNNQQKIIDYFEDRLNEQELKNFEAELHKNSALQHEVAQYRRISLYTDTLADKSLLKNLDLELKTDENSQKKMQDLLNKIHNTSEFKIVDNQAIIKKIKNSNSRNNSFFIQIAAGLIGVLSIVGFWLWNNANYKPQATNKIATKSKDLTAKSDSLDSTKNQNLTKNEPKNLQKDPELPQEKTELSLLAQNFAENSTMENNIDEVYRANTIIIAESVIPKNGENFLSKVDFAWKMENTDNQSISVKIFDNKSDLKETIELASNKAEFELNVKNYQPGLYYWQINSVLEPVYWSKFFVKKPIK